MPPEMLFDRFGNWKKRHGFGSASELSVMERRLDELVVKRGSLAKAVIQLRSVNSDGFREQQRRFIRSLPQKYHSHGTRRKVVHLSGGVDVT